MLSLVSEWGWTILTHYLGDVNDEMKERIDPTENMKCEDCLQELQRTKLGQLILIRHF